MYAEHGPLVQTEVALDGEGNAVHHGLLLDAQKGFLLPFLPFGDHGIDHGHEHAHTHDSVHVHDDDRNGMHDDEPVAKAGVGGGSAAGAGTDPLAAGAAASSRVVADVDAGTRPKVLLIGVGGGAVPMALKPFCSVVAIELDGGVIEVAEAFFGLDSRGDDLRVRQDP